MSSLVEKAEQTEQEIHLLIDGQFDLPKAVLYSVNKTDEGKTVIVKVGEHGDVYELLESSDSSKIAKVSGKLCQILNMNFQKYCQKLLKFSQSDKISSQIWSH